VKIRGVLQKADHERIIRIAKEAIAREGKIRALIIAEGFEGWERSEDWGESHDGGRSTDRKDAIVGDENGATTRWLSPPGFAHRH
jgi:hypothetical protein